MGPVTGALEAWSPTLRLRVLSSTLGRVCSLLPPPSLSAAVCNPFLKPSSDYSGTGVAFAAVGISAAAAVSFLQGPQLWRRPAWHGADRCGLALTWAAWYLSMSIRWSCTPQSWEVGKSTRKTPKFTANAPGWLSLPFGPSVRIVIQRDSRSTVCPGNAGVERDVRDP